MDALLPAFCLDGPNEMAFKAIGWRCPGFSKDLREVLVLSGLGAKNALVLPIIVATKDTATIEATETKRGHILAGNTIRDD